MPRTTFAPGKSGLGWDDQPCSRPATHYIAASGAPIPIMGTFGAEVSLREDGPTKDIVFNVSSLSQLNLLGRTGICSLDVDVTALL